MDNSFSGQTLSADGRTVAHSPHPGHVLLFDLENSRRKLHIESERLRHAAFSPDGRWLATGNWQGRGATVWDAQTGKLARDLDIDETWEPAAWPAFSPDGKWLVIGTVAEYRFWEVGSWQKKHSLPRANAGKSRGWIVFSPDGRMLAVLHNTSEVRLVDPATGREFARLPTAGTPYCFSPDGSQLVTYAGRDGAFQVWNLRLIRRQLKEMGLDWDLPPYPPPPSESAKPLRVKVLAAEPPPPSKELDAQAYLERGLLYVQWRRYTDAMADFNLASTLDPKRPPWEQMAAAFEQATTLEADCPYAWYCLALLPLQRGDRAAYRKACARMLERFGESPSADAAYWTAWSCVLAPDAVADWTKPLQLAEKAHADDGKSFDKINGLGAVLYRAGRFKEAAQRLAEAEVAFRQTPSTRVTIVYTWLFQAMAYHRLGHAAEAASWLEKAVQEIDEPSPKTAQDAATNPWNRRLTLQLLRREAEELLAKKSQ